jgi:signal peptidase
MRRPDNATLIRYAGLAAQTVVGLMAVAIATILIGPRIAGWDVVTVLSGSMAPTYPVDSVLAIEAIDPTKIEEGDVIAFKPEADQTMVSHRVVAVHETPSGDLSFTTKGDANEDPDRDPVLAKDVHGRVVFGVPVMGRLIRMAHTPLGFFLMLVVPAMFVILHEARSIRRTLREEREGKQAPGTEPVQPEQQPAMAAASPAVTIDLTEASDAPPTRPSSPPTRPRRPGSSSS